MRKLAFISLFLLAILSVKAQFVTEVYKSIDTVELSLNIYYPDGAIPGAPLPAIVFYFGGGWRGGNPGHFAPQCEYLASRGMIAIAADYRTFNVHGTDPIACVEDAKSAMRWLRANSARLMINPNMLAAGGGSAGGHLAAACATLTDFDAPTDDLSISAVPDALALFNPVLSTYYEGYGMERLGERARDFSPLHQLEEGLPPTIIFHGQEDKVVDIEQIRAFRDKATENGDQCILREFPGKGHGFFNKKGDDIEDFWKTLMETEKFLKDNKFLPGTPTFMAPEVP